MSRRKVLSHRSPCGRVSRSASPELMAPALVRRMLDSAAAGAKDPMWGSSCGRMVMTGALTAREFSTAQRWVQLSASYSACCLSPKAPRTLQFDAAGGMPPDPDSQAGRRIARSDARATADYIEGKCALQRAGADAERAVNDICVHDHAPAGSLRRSRCAPA
jgi:hypothetical protein